MILTISSPKWQRFDHSKTSCRGNLICGRCGAMGHDSLNCTEDFSCVNCKKDHSLYSRNCEKWINEKEIQIIRTQQNITYLEARKIFESRTPTVIMTYAAVILKEKDKKYQSTVTQTQFFNNNKSQAVMNKIQHKQVLKIQVNVKKKLTHQILKNL